MEFEESLNQVAAKVRDLKEGIETEEASKNAFIMPSVKPGRELHSIKSKGRRSNPGDSFYNLVDELIQISHTTLQLSNRT